MNSDIFAYMSFGEGPNLILIAVFLVLTIISLFLNIFFFFWTIKGIYVNTNGSLVSSFQWICLSQVRDLSLSNQLYLHTRFCLTCSVSLSTSMCWSGR